MGTYCKTGGYISAEVARRCGVRELGDVLRVRRLGWFGHVVRREETEILGKTQHVVAQGQRPPRRPKKTWRRNMQEELASLKCRRSRRRIEISGSVLSTVSPHENELTRC